MNMVLDTKKFRNQNFLRFHIWFIMTLYYKKRQTLLQIATAILLQNAADVNYRMHQVFLLQNVSVLVQNVIVITKCVCTMFHR